MLTQLIKYPRLAEAFHEYVTLSESFDRGDVVKAALIPFTEEMRAHGPVVFEAFKWFLERPNTMGAVHAYEELKTLNLPRWDEISEILKPLKLDAPKVGKKRTRVEVDMYPGCRSKKQSRYMNELISLPQEMVERRWNDWQNLQEQAKAERQRSLDAKVRFTPGDRVKFVSGSHEGTYGILSDQGFEQCFVQEVDVVNGTPQWTKVHKGCWLGGYYTELEKM
jgi:hypothetical protein